MLIYPLICIVVEVVVALLVLSIMCPLPRLNGDDDDVSVLCGIVAADVVDHVASIADPVNRPKSLSKNL